MKTVRMKKEDLAAWLAALRSGEYRQTQNTLFDGHGYCCLGVMQKVIGGDVERHKDEPLDMPSTSWLTSHGISFANCEGQFGGMNNSPWLPGIERTADTANDMGRTFGEIADAIEKSSEGY